MLQGDPPAKEVLKFLEEGEEGVGVRAQCENCVLALNKQIHTNGEWKIE